MPTRRQDVMPNRINDEHQDAQVLIQYIDSELAKAKGQNPEPSYIQVEFDRMSPTGRDRFSSETLDPILEYFQNLGWNFEQPSTVTLTVDDGSGSNGQQIRLFFV